MSSCGVLRGSSGAVADFYYRDAAEAGCAALLVSDWLGTLPTIEVIKIICSHRRSDESRSKLGPGGSGTESFRIPNAEEYLKSFPRSFRLAMDGRSEPARLPMFRAIPHSVYDRGSSARGTELCMFCEERE